ncbi:hypothetical protein K7432_002849 [Basidiobolus ranarum]
MENDIQEPKKGEHLVCYFEDGSFSIVPETEAVSFSPVLPPYTNYLRGSNADAFLKDKAVMLATLYWETGIVPPTFTWVRDEERYTNASVLPLTEHKTTSDQISTLHNDFKNAISKKSLEIKRETFETSMSIFQGVPFVEEPDSISEGESIRQKSQEKKENNVLHKKVKSPSLLTPKNSKISKSKNDGYTNTSKSFKQQIVYNQNSPNISATNSTSQISYSDVSPLSGPALLDSFTAGNCSHCGEYTTTRITKVLCMWCCSTLHDPWCNGKSSFDEEQGNSHKRARKDSGNEYEQRSPSGFSILSDILPRGRKQRLLSHLQSGLVPYT